MHARKRKQGSAICPFMILGQRPPCGAHLVSPPPVGARAQIAARSVVVDAGPAITTEQDRRVDDRDALRANHPSVREIGEECVSRPID